jgi:general secretion pathway protein H
MRGARGFTLFEMMIVLVILGLALGLVLSRGSWRSPGLEARAVADRIAGALRLARSQAIASDRPVYLVYDAAAHAMAVDGGAIFSLPPDIAVAMTAINSERVGNRLARIGFAPDGSSTGGQIVFAHGVDRFTIGVDWLTGRVSLADAR